MFATSGTLLRHYRRFGAEFTQDINREHRYYVLFWCTGSCQRMLPGGQPTTDLPVSYNLSGYRQSAED